MEKKKMQELISLTEIQKIMAITRGDLSEILNKLNIQIFSSFYGHWILKNEFENSIEKIRIKHNKLTAPLVWVNTNQGIDEFIQKLEKELPEICVTKNLVDTGIFKDSTAHSRRIDGSGPPFIKTGVKSYVYMKKDIINWVKNNSMTINKKV